MTYGIALIVATLGIAGCMVSAILDARNRKDRS